MHKDLTYLLEKKQSGDHEAFTALFNLLWKDLYRYAFRIVESKKEAEDIVQEIFENYGRNENIYMLKQTLFRDPDPEVTSWKKLCKQNFGKMQAHPCFSQYANSFFIVMEPPYN